ncbi:MAG: phosphoribosylamine--glycine ligase, partial [Elusimicrobiales bacterium]|nr:phosphoribosylamine--glycine ligase [Elusimicrobiales bacterium]
KADGLCSGKGVVICRDYNEAYNTLDSFMNKHIFGSSGMKVVIEEYLEGKEASVLCFVDSKRYLMLPVSRDYKRLFDGNLGPNTGGMGAIAPIDLDEKTLKEIEEDIVWRFMEAIIRERIDYKGVIYFGLMLTEDGPKVLEFNVRFGDPETQAIIPLIDDDLLEIIFEVASGNIRRSQIKVKKLKSICVVISCDSYPTSTSKDVEIFGINDIDNDVIIFHAGTKFENGKYYTNGGRILNVVGLDYSFDKAKEKVYRNISKIKFNGIHYRKDIGF